MVDNGHGKAIGSLVLGIISCVAVFTGPGALLGLILGIIGIVKANGATKLGNTEGIRTAGLVLSIIGLVCSAIALILCVIGIGAVALLAGIEVA